MPSVFLRVAHLAAYNYLMRTSLVLGILLLMPAAMVAQRGGRGRDNNATPIVLKPARVFDGEAMHEGWVVLVKGERIQAGRSRGEHRRDGRDRDRSGRHDADAGDGRGALAYSAARL